jgi:predicted HTH transcriptional regulator
VGFELHDPEKLLRTLCALPREANWVEFKENVFDAKSTGQYVSALANSAMLEKQKFAFMVWGVRDGTHELVGTSVDLAGAKVGSEPFLLWLSKFLRPRINIHPFSVGIDGKRIEMLAIEPGYAQPVSFQGQEYIRVASSIQLLRDYPEKQRALWAIASSYSFEEATIVAHMTAEQILRDFEIDKFLGLIGVEGRTPENAIDNLVRRNLISDNLQGGFEISALLALCCARDLNQFPLLRNRAPRVITYKGADKLKNEDDSEGQRGYIVGFEGLLSHILARIPSEEQMQHGRRVRVYKIPEAAIREFAANALVHQDFTQPGRPMIEIYKDRVRFINPGIPLIEIDRFIDAPPTTRNQNFVQLMRHAGYCEDRGSGVDRAIRDIEREALPPPLFATVEGSTSVTAFMPKHFADMTPDERVRACFQHAQLLHEKNEALSNGSLRARFGLRDTQMSQVSNVIRDAIDAGKIKPLVVGQAPRLARYVPAYA